MNSKLGSEFSLTRELASVDIPQGLFKGLAKLYELNLLDLSIKSLPENAFDDLQALDSLSLNLKYLDSARLSSRLLEKLSLLTSL